MSLRFLTVVLGLAVLSTFAVHAEDEGLAPIQERMSEAEFEAAGLTKLSERELAWLNAFLTGEHESAEKHASDTTGAADAPASERDAQTAQGAPPDDVGFESRERSERQAFKARIDGPFEGWSGDTEFRLANGQVWRQIQGGRFYYPDDDQPVVEFEPGFMGAWYMSVEGYNRRVRVERVR